MSPAVYLQPRISSSAAVLRTTHVALRRIGAVDPEPTFVSSPADRWIYRGAVIRTTRISSSRQLVEQRLCLFQVGGVEAFGEPAVDRPEEVAGFGAPALLAPEAGEIAGGAQFQRFRLLG